MFLTVKKFFQKNYILIFLIIILASAAFLRLYKIADYMTFLGDEGRDVLVVREILHGDLKFLGPRASAGDFYLGPIYYYFMAPFLFLSNYHPVGPAVMVALFGIATVYLVYRLGKEFWDVRAGLIAAALYAISPLVIAYSRSSWNPNIMPFFAILTLYSAHKGILNKKNWLFFISGFFLGISLQLHYLSTFLGAILFFYIIISGLIEGKNATLEKIKNISVRLLFILLGFLAGFSPFLLFEIKNNFPNTRTIINFIFTSGEVSGGVSSITIISDVFFRMYSRLITFYPPPERLPEVLTPTLNLWYFATLFIAFLSLGFVVYEFFKKIKQKDRNVSKFLLLPLWFVMGVLLFGLYKKPIYDYYFGFMFPVPFLLVGIFLSFLWSKRKAFVFVSAILILTLLVVNISGHPFQYQPNRQYDQVRKISEFILDKKGDEPFNFALITGGNSDHGYRYIFEINNRPPVTIEFPGADPERKTITDQLFVVCEIGDCQPLGHSLWEVAGFGQAEIEEEWEVSVVKVYKLVHFQEEE